MKVTRVFLCLIGNEVFITQVVNLKSYIVLLVDARIFGLYLPWHYCKGKNFKNTSIISTNLKIN
ncbi:MAG: hypothetical protein ACI9T9_000399 [Oleiphilaceae bacterium]|jgi:hypothetical protein